MLSGTGSDGTLGIKEIKAQSGMTMAQEEATRPLRGHAPQRHRLAAGGLRAAARTDAADQLLKYARKVAWRRERDQREGAGDTDQFGRIFALLRARTGHDFSAVQGHHHPPAHRAADERAPAGVAERLRAVPAAATAPEIDRLFKELLIGVTSFFRDPEAHALLANTVLPGC